MEVWVESTTIVVRISLKDFLFRSKAYPEWPIVSLESGMVVQRVRTK